MPHSEDMHDATQRTAERPRAHVGRHGRNVVAGERGWATIEDMPDLECVSICSPLDWCLLTSTRFISSDSGDNEQAHQAASSSQTTAPAEAEVDASPWRHHEAVDGASAIEHQVRGRPVVHLLQTAQQWMLAKSRELAAHMQLIW
jgi:hypothetical protein